MGQPQSNASTQLARGCQLAVRLAGDGKLLAGASAEQLSIAATFLARALAPFDDSDEIGPNSLPELEERRILPPRLRAAVRELEIAGKAIVAELRRRERDDAFAPVSQ